MNYFDDENRIIEHFQEVECSSVYFITESKDAICNFENVHDKIKWKKWTDSSGKADIPPDFFSDEFQCMMDIMRVDDHTFKNKKGKLINPTNSRESLVQDELRKSGVVEMFPNAEIMVNANTMLPTQEDHNYIFYRDNFVRTIELHKSKIMNYRNNHNNYKLIFLVLDESSGYIQVSEEKVFTSIISSDKSIDGTPHLHFWDVEFLKPIIGADIDFLLWFTPFKMIRTENSLIDLPTVCVFDIKAMNIETIKYDEKHMISCEG